MAENEKIPEQIPEKKDIFAENADVLPDREVALPEEYEEPSGNGHKTLTDVEEENPQDSDLKTTLRRLYPKFTNPIINAVAQAVMVARIFPDTILDRIYLTVVAVVEKMENDGEKNIDVMMIINMATTAFEIGLDAKGRIDAIEIHGSSRESEYDTDANRSLMGG